LIVTIKLNDDGGTELDCSSVSSKHGTSHAHIHLKTEDRNTRIGILSLYEISGALRASVVDHDDVSHFRPKLCEH
jgi:hypothetical protein